MTASVIQERKAIFVSKKTFEKFKKAAQLDKRKYDAFLNKLLDKE